MSLEDETSEESYFDAVGGLSAAKIGKTYEDLQRQYGEAAKSNQALFAAAMERLRAERTGPTTAEKLFAISSALSRPTRTGKFVETLGNVGSVLGAQEKAAREAQMERAAMLEKYGMGQSAATLEDLKTRLAGAQRMYQTAAAAETAAGKRRTGHNPVTGVLEYLDTGERVMSPVAALPRIGDVREGYEYIGGDPAQQTSWRKVR
jgi:hypothetical protein